MKKHSMPEMKEGGVNVTPLIDIVMCLIIFFMLVTKIGISRGIDKTIVLPSAILGKKIEDLGNTLSLNVHPQPSSVSSYPQITTSVDNVVKEIKIEGGALASILAEFKKVHGDKAKIIIRGDRELKYGQLQHVLIVVSNAKITDMAYETKVGSATTEPPVASAAP